MPSCGKVKKIAQDDSSRKTRNYLSKKISDKDSISIDINRQQEAKLTDIPIPLTTKFIPGYGISGETLSLGYTTDLTSQQIEQFYLDEMEKSGWQLRAQCTGYEQLLHFETPDRICSISIRPNIEKADMVIFVTPKQYS